MKFATMLTALFLGSILLTLGLVGGLIAPEMSFKGVTYGIWWFVASGATGGFLIGYIVSEAIAVVKDND